MCTRYILSYNIGLIAPVVVENGLILLLFTILLGYQYRNVKQKLITSIRQIKDNLQSYQ